MSAEPLGPDLYDYLVEALYAVPAPERRRSHWVMNREWELEVRTLAEFLDVSPRAPSMAADAPDLLLGLPYEVREDGGVPHLEPV